MMYVVAYLAAVPCGVKLSEVVGPGRIVRSNFRSHQRGLRAKVTSGAEFLQIEQSSGQEEMQLSGWGMITFQSEMILFPAHRPALQRLSLRVFNVWGCFNISPCMTGMR